MLRLTWAAVIAVAVLSGCNHLFYYPTKDTYYRREDLGNQVRDLYIPTRDKQKLHAWLVMPKGVPKGIVVHFHGNAENLTSHIGFSYWLTNHGYAVLAFDYRGYGRSSGVPSREGLVEDGRAVLRYVSSQSPWRDSDIYIWGHSLGGAVAVVSLAGEPAIKPRAMILQSTFSSYRSLARRKLADFWLTWPLQWPLSYLVTDELSPVDAIEDVNIPLLFVHEDSDPVVPKDEVMPLFAKAHEPREFWTVPGEGHGAAFLPPASPYRPLLLEYLCFHSQDQTCVGARQGRQANAEGLSQ